MDMLMAVGIVLIPVAIGVLSILVLSLKTELAKMNCLGDERNELLRDSYELQKASHEHYKSTVNVLTEAKP